ASDTQPLDDRQIKRLEHLLVACWSTLDDALKDIPADQQDIKPTRGRSPHALRLHVLEADLMHLAAFGFAFKQPSAARLAEQEARAHEQFLAGLRAVPHSEAFAPRRRYGFAWTPH